MKMLEKLCLWYLKKYWNSKGYKKAYALEQQKKRRICRTLCEQKQWEKQNERENGQRQTNSSDYQSIKRQNLDGANK